MLDWHRGVDYCVFSSINSIKGKLFHSLKALLFLVIIFIIVDNSRRRYLNSTSSSIGVTAGIAMHAGRRRISGDGME